MNTPFRHVALAAILLGFVGCSSSEADDADTAAASGDTALTEMPAMPTMQGGGDMMGKMMQHMTMMEGVSGDSMKAMAPDHIQMASTMLTDMDRQMAEMKMTANATWIATADSVRDDLRRIPEMSVAELESFKKAHHARMMRLMDMHRTMMAKPM